MKITSVRLLAWASITSLFSAPAFAQPTPDVVFSGTEIQLSQNSKDAIIPIDENLDGVQEFIISSLTNGKYGLVKKVNGTYQQIVLQLGDRLTPAPNGTYENVAQYGSLDIVTNPYPNLVFTAQTQRGMILIKNIDGLTTIDPNTNKLTQVATRYSISPVEPVAVASDDIDNDGNPDVVVCDNLRDEVRIYAGNGAGGFEGETANGGIAEFQVQGSALNVGGRPKDVQIADVDGDGYKDIITANFGGALISVLYQTPMSNPPTFVLQTYGAPQTSQEMGGLRLADLNGDGLLDIAAVNSQAGFLYIFYNQYNAQTNTRGFSAPYQEISGGSFPIDLRIAPFGLDRKPSIVIIHRDTNALTFFTQAPNGDYIRRNEIFGGSRVYPNDFNLRNFGTGSRARSISVGDFDHDGKVDLAIVGSSNSAPEGNRFIFLRNSKTFQRHMSSKSGYGVGNCTGSLGISANGSTRWGSSDLNISVTNGPENGKGLLLISFDVLQNPLSLFINGYFFNLFANINQPWLFDFREFDFDQNGNGSVPFPLPFGPTTQIPAYFQAVATDVQLDGPGANPGEVNVCTGATGSRGPTQPTSDALGITIF